MSSKLTDDQINEIRKKGQEVIKKHGKVPYGFNANLGKEYGVTSQFIGQIILGTRRVVFMENNKKEKKTNSNGYSGKRITYILKMEDFEDYYKIGSTNSIDFRISSLQTGNPFKLICITSIYEEYLSEKELQQLFSKYKIRNEWFQIPLQIFKPFLIKINEMKDIISRLNTQIIAIKYEIKKLVEFSS